MTERQFLWGLSGGISVFALAGAFWFGLAYSTFLAPRAEWWIWTLFLLAQFGVLAALLFAAFRLRRRSGFKSSEFRHPDPSRRSENRRIRIGFAWTTAGQALLVGLGVWWSVHVGRQEMIWPWIGLIVSLHFVPLARLFHVRAYYTTALAGALISLASFAGLENPHNVSILGGALAAVMWLTAAYVIRNAGRIAAAADIASPARLR